MWKLAKYYNRSRDTKKVFPALGLNASGDRIVTVGNSDKSVRVWNAETGEPITVFQGHASPPTCATFNPGGGRVASSDASGMAKVWETATGEELYEVKGPNAKLLLIQFLPDGNRVRTGAADKRIRLWELDAS